VKRIILLAVAAAALSIGGFAAVGVAAPPPANPGSPGDNCSHGNSNQPCKPDPQPTHGKDCDDHGNARGNEDHCGPGETETTPTETTPTETTPTETTPTTTEETVTTSTTSTPSETESQTTTESGSGTTPSPQPSAPAPGSSSATSGGSSGPGVLPTRKSLEKALEKQSSGVDTSSAATHPAATSELPNTGLPLGAWVALGLSLVGSGVGLRRKAGARVN
jgi:hypothetical protein